MKKIIIALIAIVMVVCSFTLVACSNKDSDIIANYIFEQDGLTVDSDFVLPLTIGGKKAEWKSNSNCVTLEKLDEEWRATVSYPESGIETVTLTLTVGKASKDFTVLVKAIDVYSFLDNYVFKKDKATVVNNFDLDRSFTFQGKTCNISWSVDEDSLYLAISEDGNQCKVIEQDVLTPAKIYATFEYNGVTAKKEYSINVYREMLGLELVDFWYGNTGVSIEMSGYVVAIATEYSAKYENVSLYMVNDDYTAGYYLFQCDVTAEDAELLKPGVHITTTGTTNTNYYGLIETNKNGSLVVDKDWEIPYDESKAVLAVDDLVIGNLPATIYNESRLVSLTNWKVLCHLSDGIEEDAKKYTTTDDNFTLMMLTKGGVNVAVRVSKYLAGVYTKGDDTHAGIIALLDSYAVGSTVNVQGIFTCYNGVWQIMPLNASAVTAGGEADADDKNDYDGNKVALAVKDVNAKVLELGLDKDITSKKECQLLTESNGVKISYYIRKSNSITIDKDGKMVITPGNPETTAIQVQYSINDFNTVQYIYVYALIPSANSMIAEVTLPDSINSEYTLPTIDGAELVWSIKSGSEQNLKIENNNKLVPTLGADRITYIISLSLKYNDVTKTKNFVVIVDSISSLTEGDGTENNPYTIADLIKISSTMATTDTKSNIYFKGYIKELGDWSEEKGNYNNGYFADTMDSADTLYAYIINGIDGGTLLQGDKVVASVESFEYYANSSIWELKKVHVTKVLYSSSTPAPEGDEIVIYNQGKYVTGEVKVYTSSSGTSKDQLVLSSKKADAQKFIKVINDDKTVSFITPDWKYLYNNGTNVNLAEEASEYTSFVLEEVEGGYYIKCEKAISYEKVQYLEVYSGYLTCYGFNESSKSAYLFELQEADAVVDEPVAPEFSHAGTADDPYTIADVNKMFDAKYTGAENFYIKAYVIELLSWSDKYGNYSYAYLADTDDGEGKAYVYIFKGDKIADVKVGDQVICTVQSVGTYNDNWQMNTVVITEIIDNGTVEPGPVVHEHSYGDLVNAKEPTCGVAGNIAYYLCECGQHFDADKNEVASVVIDPTYDHDYDDNGLCSVCNYQKHALAGKNVTIANDGKYVTGEKYEYVGTSYTKIELVLRTDAVEAVKFNILDNGDGSVRFLASDLFTYLYCNGTDVKFVEETGDYTSFVLETVDGGYYIKSLNGQYNGKVQYLEVHYGYLTCYGAGTGSAYLFVIDEIKEDAGGEDEFSIPTWGNAEADVILEWDGSEYWYYTSFEAYAYESFEANGIIETANDDGTYSFNYARGNTVTFSVSADGSTVTLSDTLLELENVELAYGVVKSDEGGDEGGEQGEIASFSADQQGTYTLAGGPSGDVIVTISESKVAVNWSTQGLEGSYDATIKDGIYYVVFDPSYEDEYLSFSFDNGVMSYYIYYYNNKLDGTASKSGSGDEGGSEVELTIKAFGNAEAGVILEWNGLNYWYYTSFEAYAYESFEANGIIETANDDGTYSFYYAQGKSIVTFSVSADGSTVTLSDTLLELENVELTLDQTTIDDDEGEEVAKGELVTSVVVENNISGQEWTAPASGKMIFEVDGDPLEWGIDVTDSATWEAWGDPNYIIYDSKVIEITEGEVYYFSSGESEDITINVYAVATDKGTTAENPYTVDELWDAFNSLEHQEASEEQFYVKGIISTVPSYNGYGYTFDFVNSKDATIQGYSVQLGDVATTICQNDEVVIYGYIYKYNSVLEVAYVKTIGVNPQLISRVAGNSTVSFTENENADITVSVENGVNGSEFSITVSPKNEAVIDAVKVNGVAVTANEDGSYTGVIAGNTVVTVDARIPVEGPVTSTVDFSNNFENFGWDSTYKVRSLSSSDLGISDVSLSVDFTNANKQGSNTAIQDIPVVATKGSAQYVTVSVSGVSISSITFNLREWSTGKKFTTVTIEYTTDGSTWVATNVGLVNGTASAISTVGTTLVYEDLPENVSAVRLVVVGSTSTSNTQVGIEGFTIVTE